MKHEWNWDDLPLSETTEQTNPAQTERTQPKPKTGDPLVRYVFSQFAVCLAALAAVAVITLLGGDVYRNVRDKYIDLFCEPTTVDEVVDVLSRRLQTESAPAAVTPTETAQPEKAENNASSFRSLQPVASEKTAPATLAAQASVATTANLTRQTVTANQMALPVHGNVTSEFGYRLHPIYGTTLFHGGVDIGAELGSDVCAALDGEVVTAEYGESYGNYIVVDHGGGFQTVYGHCSKLLVQEGDRVKKGQTIALVGSTGVSTGPHLHFEVRSGGQKIDPRWLIDLE